MKKVEETSFFSRLAFGSTNECSSSSENEDEEEIYLFAYLLYQKFAQLKTAKQIV